MKTTALPSAIAFAVLQVLAAPSHAAPAKISRTSYRVSRSLSQVSNLAAFSKAVPISASQRELLARNAFAVTPTNSKQMFFVYEDNDYKNIPSLVTTDSVLNVYHLFFDFSLRKVEAERLLPILKRLSAGMVTASVQQLNAATSDQIKDAARRNAAFFGVADRLLGGSTPLPEDARKMVSAEMELIGSHRGFGVGQVFPYKIDYSQFVPRGHYTRSEDLKKFFRAMMWFGLAPFASAGGAEPNNTPLLQGLLWTRALYSKGLDQDWERIYEPTSFYVGAADDVTPSQFKKLSDEVFGADASLESFADDAKLASFAQKLEEINPAQIKPKFASQMGKPIPSGADAVRGPLPGLAQLRFMGQRYVPDSEVLQNLSEPFKRPFPSGLDVMAAFGSARASALLDQYANVYNPGKWSKYLSVRAETQAKFAALPSATWSSNLYYGWLYALKALNDPAPAGAPSFMRNAAWQDKSLWTALGSWAQLRHDTVLFVKQSAVEMGGGEDERPFVKGYVEPNAAFYDRLLSLTKSSREGLMKRSLLPQDLYEQFTNFETTLSGLRGISRKELAGQALTREEYETIRFIGGQLEAMMIHVMGDGKGSYWSDVPQTDRDMATIADVHTASSQVLEAGVGRAHELLAVVPVEGQLLLARGATFSFYEFKQPAANRLTDEQWQAMLKSNQTPAPPVWTQSFLASGTRRINEEAAQGFSGRD